MTDPARPAPDPCCAHGVSRVTGLCLTCIALRLPPPPPPIPVAANTVLRDLVAAEVRSNLVRRTFPPLAPGGVGFGLSEYDIADVVLAIAQPAIDKATARGDIWKAKAIAIEKDRDQLLAVLARVDEEIAEFQAAAEDDPTTPAACLDMIELLRIACTKET